MHRNVCCPAYDICLTAAARADQPFDCTSCCRRHAHEEIPWEEIEPCILLLWAVFRPERWRAYLQLKKSEAAGDLADMPDDAAWGLHGPGGDR